MMGDLITVFIKFPSIHAQRGYWGITLIGALHQRRHHYIIITSSTLKFIFLIGTRSVMKNFHYCPRPLSLLSRHSSNGPLNACTSSCTCDFIPSNTRYQPGKPLFSSSRCRNSTKNVKYENPGISGDRPYRFLNTSVNFYAPSGLPNRQETL